MLALRIRYRNRELRATKLAVTSGVSPLLATQRTLKGNKLPESVGNRTPRPFHYGSLAGEHGILMYLVWPNENRERS